MTLTPASLLAQIKCGREYSATQLAQHYAKSTEAVRDMLTTLVHQGRLRTCQRSWQTFYFSDTTAGSAMTGQDGVRSDVQTTKATPAARYTADGNLSGYEAQFALQRSLALITLTRMRHRCYAIAKQDFEKRMNSQVWRRNGPGVGHAIA